MKKDILLAAGLLLVSCLSAREYHVSPSGSDAGEGTQASPFRTITYAAQVALPGDTVTAHNGVYNPFNEKLYGDWLWSEHTYHTGDIYLNDVSLYETTSLEKVFTPDTIRSLRDPEGTPFVLDKDYLGKTRSGQAPTVGPVETLPHGNRIRVW